MALSPGVRLGPYEIPDALGAGGMGESIVLAIRVWSELSRSRSYQPISPKILRASHGSNAKRKRISGLSHPHICALYDIGHQDGVDFLVMEFVEGETLAKRLAKGPLPLGHVLKYGEEIADALDRAHRRASFIAT